ncbi:hypothetical protein HCU40_09565 [Pseudanabaena biceps]|nr:hypothetical protein [Pseudanabaena biceps]
MNSHNSKSNPDQIELWFAKFFIGSMVAISLLTIVLSFLPASSELRTSPTKSTTDLTQTKTLGILKSN